jgi:hypothetical protein
LEWQADGVSDHSYVARFGWTPRDLVLVPVCILFVIVGAVMVGDGQLVGAFACVLGGGYVLLVLVAGVSRRVALAVTAEGIMLGLIPPWPARHSAFVPWADIEAVVLWRQGRGWRSIRYIGVVRRAGAPPLPGSARSPLLRSLNQAVVPPGLAEDLVADSRQVSFWRLDRTRLTAAVSHFRPGLPIEDHT